MNIETTETLCHHGMFVYPQNDCEICASKVGMLNGLAVTGSAVLTDAELARGWFVRMVAELIAEEYVYVEPDEEGRQTIYITKKGLEV